MSSDEVFDQLLPEQPSGQNGEERREREREERSVFSENDETEEPLDPNHLDAITEYGRTPIVSVIGFGNSGKSFFVNRLRQDLPSGPWKVWPRAAEIIDTTPEGIELTRLVPTDVRLSRGRNHGYVVVDCAGESFVQALEGQFKTGTLDGVLARSYLAAISLASALILVIRTEDILEMSRAEQAKLSDADRSQREFVRKQIVNGFEDIINVLVVSRERLLKEEPEAFLRHGLSREELAEAFKRNQNLCRQPLLVAFSQADRLGNVYRREDAYDADPFSFAMASAPTLVNAVHRTFKHYRFDFMSAFYGHNADGPDRRNADYELPSYGARDVFLWIHNLLQPRPWTQPFKLARRPIPTRHVVRLRRRLDSDFDGLWRKAWS